MDTSIDRKRIVAGVTVLVLLAVVGLVVWSVIQERARAAKTESEILKEIKPEELKHVLKSEATADVVGIRELNESPEKRKEFLDGLTQHLALAAAARRDGFAEQEDFKVNFAYKTDILLGDLYQAKLSREVKRGYVVAPEEMENVWKDPANEERFKKVMDTFTRIRERAADAKNETIPVRPLKGESLRKARDNFARTTVLAGMARKDKKFMSQPAIPLRIKILEAGLLSNDYLIANYQQFIPTQADIKAYLAKHREYDPKRKLELAQAVLAKVKAGEDFDKLAARYSEDKKSSDRGGLYEDFYLGALWPKVEDRIKTMEPGELADELVVSEFGYHIVKYLGSKKDPKTGRTVYSLKHIALQKKFQEPGKPIPGMARPFMTPEEIAREEVEKQKRDDFIARITRTTPVSIPDDFKLEFEGPAKNESAKQTVSRDKE